MIIKMIAFSLRLVIVNMVLLLSVPLTVSAAEVKDLFSVDIPVHGQGDTERLQAIREGLATVMIKVSGRRETPAMPEMETVLNSPMQYVQQFRYYKLPQEWQQAVDDKGRFYSQLLRVSYDGQAVSHLLREAKLPVWGRARPSTLVWLAVEDWNQRTVLGAGNLPAIREVLQRQANQRGLPLIFPLLDLQDQSALGYADIWGDFQDAIMQASARYQAGSVLVGRVYRQAANQWQARWTMYLQDEVQHWVTEGLQQQQVLSDGMDIAADRFAERFARLPTGADNSQVTLKIFDVESLPAYARVMKYLESLDLTKDVLVDRLDGDSVTLSLTLRGDLQRLEQAIVFGETLAPLKQFDETPLVSSPGSGTGSDTGTEAKSDEDEPAGPVLAYRLLP